MFLYKTENGFYLNRAANNGNDNKQTTKTATAVELP